MPKGKEAREHYYLIFRNQRRREAWRAEERRIGQDGLKLLQEILEIYRAYNFSTQVLAASLRHPMHVVEAAKMGSHIGTMPYKVFEQLFHHPLTDKGLAGFLSDWEKARGVLGNILPAAAGKAGR